MARASPSGKKSKSAKKGVPGTERVPAKKKISATKRASASPKPSRATIPFVGTLPFPDATVSHQSFGPILFSVRVDATIKSNKVAALAFTTSGPPEFVALFARACPLFLGKSESDIDFFSYARFLEVFPSSADQKEWAHYIWTALQDVCARLPWDDPLSRAIGKIARLHDEFPHGNPSMDEED